MIPAGMSLKEIRRYMAADASRYGAAFVEMPLDGGPKPPRLVRALRNRQYLVQLYEPEPHQVAHVMLRMSVNRAVLNDRGTTWEDGITWDQLQAIKNEVGFADHDALEVFPRVGKVVNVAAIRHLWILREPLPWAWGAENKA